MIKTILRDSNKVDLFNLRKPPLIHGVDFTDEDVKIVLSSNKLLTLTYLISNKCNFNCPYCYTNAGCALQRELTFEECKDIFRQATNLGAETIWIPGSGEPFLDKNFFDNGQFPIIDYANSRGLSVTFFTNGYFISKEIAETLSRKNVSVITKVNSFKADVQDFLVGQRGAFYKMQEGLRNLIEAGFNKDVPSRLGINTVITKQNYDEIIPIYKFCRNNNIIPYVSLTLHGGRANQHKELDVPTGKIKELFYKALELDQKEYGYTWTPSPPIIADQCKKLYYDIVVTSTGDVRFCPGINISIGNIREKPLSKIMQDSELLHRIRNMQQHLKGKCGDCTNDSCAYGCRLEAYTSGDIFAADPSCWWSC